MAFKQQRLISNSSGEFKIKAAADLVSDEGLFPGS
jgi:hypothetical protein